jgi:hypothetical protein
LKYNQPFGISDVNAGFINGDPEIDRAGSIPPAAVFEYPQRELVALVGFSGLTPSDADLTQVSKAIQTGKIWYGIDVSTTPGQVIVALSPTPDNYYPGMTVRVKIANDNPGASIFKIDPRIFFPIRSNQGLTELVRNDLRANTIAELTFDGNYWRLMSGSPSEVVRKALFPFAKFKNSGGLYGGSLNLPSSTVTALSGWAAGVGDPSIVSAFNTANSAFTVPVGYGGLWTFTGYVNSLTSPTTGIVPTAGFGLRMYEGLIADGNIASASNSPASVVIHATVKQDLVLADGAQVQLAGLHNDADPALAGLKNYSFTAVRLGRSAP